MPEKLWKKSERAIAGLLGGVRVPVSGRARGDAPDVRHDWLSIECKHRKEVPAWLQTALVQARAAARGDQLPVAIIHQQGCKHNDDLVALRLADFVDWFGTLGDS